MSGWLTKKPAKKQQTPVKPKIKLLPDTPQYQKKFREESPSPSPPPNRLVGFTSSMPMPPAPPPKLLTEAEQLRIQENYKPARRMFAWQGTPSPSQLLPPPPPRRDNTDIGSLDETQTQHESVFNLEEEHTQHASETQKVDSPNGGKMTRKKDKNKSKKGKSKSKKGKNKRTIKKRKINR